MLRKGDPVTAYIDGKPTLCRFIRLDRLGQKWVQRPDGRVAVVAYIGPTSTARKEQSYDHR